MNAEAQRIAIAEACGWRWWGYHDTNGKPFHFFHPPSYTPEIGIRQGGKVIERPENYLGFWRDTPNYLLDLNAIHEAEKTLNDAQMTKFTEKLFFHCAGANDEREWFICHATAAHRSEAFLRAIGKWKDS